MPGVAKNEEGELNILISLQKRNILISLTNFQWKTNIWMMMIQISLSQNGCGSIVL